MTNEDDLTDQGWGPAAATTIGAIGAMAAGYELGALYAFPESVGNRPPALLLGAMAFAVLYLAIARRGATRDGAWQRALIAATLVQVPVVLVPVLGFGVFTGLRIAIGVTGDGFATLRFALGGDLLLRGHVGAPRASFVGVNLVPLVILFGLFRTRRRGRAGAAQDRGRPASRIGGTELHG